MYDTVEAGCTGCNTIVTFKSEAGNCTATHYGTRSVPYAIALDLDGDSKVCPNCGAHVVISFLDIPKTVEMVVTPF